MVSVLFDGFGSFETGFSKLDPVTSNTTGNSEPSATENSNSNGNASVSVGDPPVSNRNCSATHSRPPSTGVQIEGTLVKATSGPARTLNDGRPTKPSPPPSRPILPNTSTTNRPAPPASTGSTSTSRTATSSFQPANSAAITSASVTVESSDKATASGASVIAISELVSAIPVGVPESASTAIVVGEPTLFCSRASTASLAELEHADTHKSAPVKPTTTRIRLIDNASAQPRQA